MAETEFIGPGGIVRQTILNNQPVNVNWSTASAVKTESQVVMTVANPGAPQNFYPATYEWKVDDSGTAAIQVSGGGSKKGGKNHGRNLQQQQSVSVPLASVDIKPIPQTIIAQCSNAWTSNSQDYQTIKWESSTGNPNSGVTVVTTKPSTLNTTGLQFISAPATAVAQTSSTGTMIIHGNRSKTGGTIIETFKCEVCNQIYASMIALQNHVAQVHEVGLNKRQKKSAGFAPLHCEYKYSGLSLADSVQQPAAQQLPTIIATGGPAAVVNGSGFIQAPTNLTITSIGNGINGSHLQTSSSMATTQGIIITKNGKIRKEKKRNWQCGVCHNRFSRKDHLAKHVSAVHEKVRPFDCLQCGQKFSQKHHLRAHMLARHEDDKMAAKAFACQQCPKRFTRNDHLERHIESGIFPFMLFLEAYIF